MYDSWPWCFAALYLIAQILCRSTCQQLLGTALLILASLMVEVNILSLKQVLHVMWVFETTYKKNKLSGELSGVVGSLSQNRAQKCV